MEHGRRFVSVSVPEMNDLRCLIGRVNSDNGIRDSSVESLHHFRILQCRLLIDSSPEIIASPGIVGLRRSDPSEIYILAKNKYFSTGEIQQKLRNMDIEHSEPIEVTSQLYKACLLYTMQQKLSPRWNKVGKYLLLGEHFLASISAPTNAIKLDVALDGEETRLAISPACVTVPAPLSLSYFSLPPTIVKNFIDNETGFIDLLNFSTQTWVFVLPSLKKGRVVSISKKIPEYCPFRDYEQLRSHWKNMYGYLMPETEIGLIYYQLNFPGLGNSAFTYPSCCVSSDKLDLLFVKKGNYVVSQFLNELTATVPKICGTEFKTEDDKENVQNTSKIFSSGRFGTSQDYLSGNFYSGTDSGRSPLSVISNNPANGLKPKRNSIEEILNMKPFLQFQSTNRRYLTPFSDEFVRSVENERLGEETTRVKVETSPEGPSQNKEDLLKSRRSFDLSDFCEKNSDLKTKIEEKFCNDDEVEVKSKYFEDLGQSRVEKLPAEKESTTKLHLRRLSNRNLSKRVAGFKTKDISSYFKETKVKAKSSEPEGNMTETSGPAKLVQTHLNFLKRSEDVDSYVEAKKMKFVE